MSTKMVILEPRDLRREAWEGVVDSPGSAVRAYHMLHDADTWSLMRILNGSPAMHFAAHHINHINSTSAASARPETVARDHEEASYRMSNRLHHLLGRPPRDAMLGFNESLYPRHLDLMFAKARLPRSVKRGRV